MQRACLLAAILLGMLLAARPCAAAEDLYQVRVWTNTRNEVIDGQLLAVNSLSAHILCDEEVYDIPLNEFAAIDRSLLFAEIARKRHNEAQATSIPSPSSGSSGYVDPYEAQRRSYVNPQYSEPQEPLNFDHTSIREQLFSPRWNNGNNNAAYQAGQFVGYFSLVAIAIGVLYRFYTS